MLLGACGLLAVAALFGVGPLYRKAQSVTGSDEGKQEPRSPDGDSSIDQLIRLGELRGSGEISQEEFEVAKGRIIGL